MLDDLRRLRWLTRALAACVFAAACIGPSRTGLAPAPAGSVVWSPCDGGSCGALRVPLDYAAPSGPTIELALVRISASDSARRIGVLFVNPGGPGVSAVAFLRSGSGRFSGAVRERFDLVAVDARGTGGSARLDCHASLPALLAQDPDASDDAAWQAMLAASRALAEECARKHGALLPYLGTGESARDLDAVRAALGEAQLSYVGYSYGTALGATYATLFPERVRAMVLDGAIDPSFELFTFAREQAVAVEAALVAYDAKAEAEGWHGVDAFDLAYARAPQKSTVLYGAAEGLSSPPEGWRDLALALGEADGGQPGAFDELANRYFGRRSDGTSALTVEAQIGTLCADTSRPLDAESYRAALPAFAAASPHFGRANLLSHLPCAFWPAPARALESPGAETALPIVVVANDRDPLTPPAWGGRLAARFPKAVLVEVSSAAHTAYGNGDCVDALVDAYLIERVVPPAGSRCR
jgi:pimeloyl-ACP methyl ester carboxylesterase